MSTARQVVADEAKIYGIIIGLIINIFIAGVGWGTLWTKVSNLEKRLDRFEITNLQSSKIGPSPFGPYPEAPLTSSGHWGVPTAKASEETDTKSSK